MPPLAARDVENSCSGRRAEDVDEPGDLAPVALEGEEWLVLEQILRVEVVFPPVSA